MDISSAKLPTRNSATSLFFQKCFLFFELYVNSYTLISSTVLAKWDWEEGIF